MYAIGAHVSSFISYHKFAYIIDTYSRAFPPHSADALSSQMRIQTTNRLQMHYCIYFIVLHVFILSLFLVYWWRLLQVLKRAWRRVTRIGASTKHD